MRNWEEERLSNLNPGISEFKDLAHGRCQIHAKCNNIRFYIYFSNSLSKKSHKIPDEPSFRSFMNSYSVLSIFMNGNYTLQDGRACRLGGYITGISQVTRLGGGEFRFFGVGQVTTSFFLTCERGTILCSITRRSNKLLRYNFNDVLRWGIITIDINRIEIQGNKVPSLGTPFRQWLLRIITPGDRISKWWFSWWLTFTNIGGKKTPTQTFQEQACLYSN